MLTACHTCTIYLPSLAVIAQKKFPFGAQTEPQTHLLTRDVKCQELHKFPESRTAISENLSTVMNSEYVPANYVWQAC